MVGLQLRHQTNASAFVTAHVENDAAPCLVDHAHGVVQLLTAVAAARSQCVAGEAFGVHTHEDILAIVGRHIPHNESDMLDTVDKAAVTNGTELAVVGRQLGFDNALNQVLVVATVFDELLDGNQR